MSIFLPLSLNRWMEKKELSFQRAVDHCLIKEQEETFPQNLHEALMEILNACNDDQVRTTLLSSPLKQGELLSLLASVPLRVRLRFLDVLSHKSLPLLSSLMDEAAYRGPYRQDSLYLYESFKKVYAFKVFFDVFASENLSRMLILLERKQRHEF